MSAAVLAAKRAWKARDAAAFETAMHELGVVLDLAAFRAFCDVHREWWELVGDRLLELVYAAVHGELGYAMACDYTRTMLVARTAEHVAIGAQPGTTVKQPFPERGWPIKRWSKTDPAKNVALVDAWVAGVVDHAHVMIVRRVPAPIDVAGRAHGDAVFAALVADPTDAGARAVYADWLLERGDPRGEIMRLHAEGRRDEARERTNAAHDLIREHVPKCVRRARDWTGLVEGIEIVADDLARHGAALFARHPIHELDLIATEPKQLRRLAAAKTVPLERIRALDLEARVARGTIGDVVAIEPSALGDTRVFESLRALRLRGIGDGVDEWRRFVGAMHAPALATLTLGDVAGPVVTRFVVAPTTLPGLRDVRLWSQRWLRRGNPQAGDAAFALVSALVQRERLEAVMLAGWEPGEAVMAQIARLLAESPSILDVTLTGSIDDRAVRALAAGKFERVSLTGEMHAAGVAELVDRLPLRRLELWCTSRSAVDDVVRVIERAPARLAHVHWQHPDLTADQAARIAATRTLEEHVIRG